LGVDPFPYVFPWVASFDGPSAFLATLLILHFCCVLVKCFCYMENKLSLSLFLEVGPLNTARGCGERCKLPQWDLGGTPAEIEFCAF